VYVWVPGEAGVITDFVERYVDPRDPGDERLAAFLRAYVTGTADDSDRAALADLRRDDADPGFSLYLKARDYYGAIIAVTGEGAAVLGLSIDDPYRTAVVQARARALLDQLRAKYASPAGRAGWELIPAHSRHEWEDDEGVQFRVGQLPPNET
jgi:hypothetical protein